MKNHNFEAFRPLSEEEEKHVVGGRSYDPANKNPACAPIMEEIHGIQGNIKSLSSQGIAIPSALVQQLAQLEDKLKQCEHHN